MSDVSNVRRFLGDKTYDTLKTDVLAGVQAAPSEGNGTLPSGLIVMWSGTLTAIPQGWQLCDGTNGTPDLRDRFIVGASNGEQPGGTGGNQTLSHNGVTIEDHAALTHSGCAVTDHPATATSAADVGATKIGSTTSTATLKAHKHNTPVLAHTVTQPDSHAAQTHVVTQLVSHGDIRPPYFKLAFIMKV